MKQLASLCFSLCLAAATCVALPEAAGLSTSDLRPSTNAAAAISAALPEAAELPTLDSRPSTHAAQRRLVVAIADYIQTNGVVSARRAMTETLLAAGLVPVVLPEMDEASADLLLARCDAVLLGGAVPDHDGVRRRAFEERILKLAVKRGLIVVGICHGCQMINRYYGGTLSRVPKGRELVHKNVELRARTGMLAEHLATVLPGDSLMSRTFGEGQVRINSSHKYRCEKIASGFRVTAVSEEDGIVEAIEHESLPIFGFQFHPEYYWRKDPRFLELIRRAFIVEQ